MLKKQFTDGQKISRHIHIKMHWFFIAILVASILFIIVAVFADLCPNAKEVIYHFIAKKLCSFGTNWYERGRKIKNIISENMEEFYDILMTITTILAAIVIFFYSIQDNKREGVPHRAILTYSFGSYTVPLYFILSIFILPISFWLLHFNMRVTFIVCMVVSYIFQMAIIIIILCSTLHTYGRGTIRNAEIRQYKMLCKIKKQDDNNLNSNPQFTWIYLMHHLEQAVVSDELIDDKMMLVRELLKTPYYKKKIFPFRKSGKRCCSVDGMSKICLKKNNLERIYEFYYGSLSAVIEHLSNAENSSERSRIYLALYEFLDNLQELYCKVGNFQYKFLDNLKKLYCKVDGSQHKYLNNLKKLYCKVDKIYQKSRSKAMGNYMMTIAGMMNAVLDSGVPDAEGFCNYVLNKCIKDENMRRKQIGLYFLFQEYLYRTNNIEWQDGHRLMPIQYYDRIHDIAGWYMKQEDEELYYDFWNIWMDWTTISDSNRINIFKNAIAALKGEKFCSSLLSYIMLAIKHMEKSTHEIKSDSIN